MNEEPYELPTGWTWVKLVEVGTIIGGGTPRRDNPAFYKNGTIPWATPTDIDPRDILTISRTSEMITDKAVRESSAKLLPVGTVLFSSRASIGKIAIAGTELATNQGFANVIPTSGLDSKYLAYGLRNFTKDIERLGSGTTYLEVAKSSLKEFRFPLAPLNEQKRIVNKVEALFAESNTVREALDKVLVLLRRFRQAILSKAFKGELTHRDPNDGTVQELLCRIRQVHLCEEVESAEIPFGLPEGWAWARMEELLTLLQYGTSEKANADNSTGVPILRMGNIQERGLDISNLKYMSFKESEKNKYALKKGDILINRTNSPELVGKSAIFDLDKEFVFASYLIRLQPNPKILVSSYLNFFINSTFGKRYIERVRHQVAGQANVNSKNIKNMPIPLPPVAEQERIVSKIRRSFDLANTAETAINNSLKIASRVDQAIMIKAFRGELVPQDPGDEPASVLLQRIKAGIVQ